MLNESMTDKNQFYHAITAIYLMGNTVSIETDWFLNCFPAHTFYEIVWFLLQKLEDLGPIS